MDESHEYWESVRALASRKPMTDAYVIAVLSRNCRPYTAIR
jgi:hypothetical protein